MTSEQLLQFKKVAELQHMTRAAEALFMTQANLSRSISALEHELGCPLFDRVGRGIKLNEAGRVFYQHCVNILGEFGEAKAQIRQLSERQKFRISFATNTAAYTPALFSLLNKEMPEVLIKQTSAPRQNLISMLKNGRVDFVITAPPIIEMGIESREILIERPAVIYPKGHWLEGRASVRLEELADEKLVGVQEGYGARDCMSGFFEEQGVHPAFVIETSESATIGTYVKLGLGIAIIPKSVALRDPHFCDGFADLEGEYPCPVCLSWRTGFSFGEVEKRFAALVASFFEEKMAPTLQ